MALLILKNRILYCTVQSTLTDDVPIRPQDSIAMVVLRNVQPNLDFVNMCDPCRLTSPSHVTLSQCRVIGFRRKVDTGTTAPRKYDLCCYLYFCSFIFLVQPPLKHKNSAQRPHPYTYLRSIIGRRTGFSKLQGGKLFNISTRLLPKHAMYEI